METNVINIRGPRKSSLELVDVVKQARFILEKIDGQKLTEKGFLPRKLTAEFWETQLRQDELFRPHREADCMELHRLHFLFAESGYLRWRAGRVWLTKLAKQILSDRDYRILYRQLFISMVTRYEWGHDDRYPGFPEIQQMAMEMIRALVGKDAISPEDLFSAFFEPIAIDESPNDYNQLEDVRFLAEEPIRCLQTRFFDRFCLPFGLLTSERDPSDFGRDLTDLYRPTEFFRQEFPSVMEV